MWETAGIQKLDVAKFGVDEDDWPCFEIRDVIITSTAYNGELVDLMSVTLSSQISVRGKLVPPEDEPERSLIINEAVFDNIHISPVYTYSLETDEDGDLKYWVLGKCGWYAIVGVNKVWHKPWVMTIEKGRLWQFMEDVQDEEGSEQWTMEQFYQKFHELEGYEVETAETFFKSYREFLIAKILEKEEVFQAWQTSRLWMRLVNGWPETVERIRTALQHKREAIAKALAAKSKASMPSTSKSWDSC